ncbi:MAG: tetratricopeptide repeat protein [Prevotella sp.]|nr:tetratricopeptide repeat protein [Prevotella sp.]
MNDEYFDSEEFRELLTEYEESMNAGMPVFMDADELSDIADYYQQQERYDDALTAVDMALERDPGAIGPLTYKIHEALWAGNIDEAKGYLEQISDTDDPDYVYDKAEIMLAEEKPDEANQYLHDELKNVPADEYQDYVIDVANIFADYNYPEEAMQWMSRAKQEDSPEFKELKARTLFGLGKYQDSEKLWGELIDANPFSKHYWNALASTQFMSENYSASVESSEFAIAIDPDDPDGLLSKATALFRLNNYEEALKYFERYSEHVPDDEFGLMNQGTCLINLGRNDEAIAKLNEAIFVAPPDSEYLSDIYQELSFAYSEEGNDEKALQMLDKADEHDSDKVQTLVVRGHIMLASGQVRRAEGFFRKAVVQSDTPNETLLRIIVSIYDNHFLEAAYTLFRKFFQIIPDDFGQGYAYMALVCHDLKHYDEFLHYLKTACLLNPQECKTALGHLFPDDVEPKDYYDYIKDRMAQP